MGQKMDFLLAPMTSSVVWSLSSAIDSHSHLVHPLDRSVAQTGQPTVSPAPQPVPKALDSL
jgi:hypothetical protein